MKKSKLNILFTTQNLQQLAGSKTHAVTLAIAAKHAGAAVAIASRGPVNGPMFNLAKAAAPVIDYRFLNEAKPDSFDLAIVNQPQDCYNDDVRRTCKRIFQICHGLGQSERPHPDMDHYIAVSEEVFDNLDVEPKTLIRNPINFDIFRPLYQPNNKVYTLAHVSNYKSIPGLSELCDKLGITFLRVKNDPEPWRAMNKADLVVALGRSALEAMACGREVLIYGNRGYMAEPYCDGLASERYYASRMCNFSGRGLGAVVDLDGLETIIRDQRSLQADGEKCLNYVSQHHDSNQIIKQILAL